MRRLLLPAVLLVVAVGSGAVAASGVPRSIPPARSTRSSTPVAAPLLSPRRAPDVLRRAIGDVRLRAHLTEVLAGGDLGDARNRTCLVVRHAGRTLLEVLPDEQLLPASTLKLLTATAVLGRLGADAKLTTEVRTAREPTAGVVDGDLWLIGGGDPLLATADYAASFPNQPQVRTPFEGLADAIVAAGIREIRGGVVGDDSRFDAQRFVPSWRPGYVADGHVGPIGALVVNDGFSSFTPRRVATADPAAHAAAVLTDLLRARNVAVGAAPRHATAAAGDHAHLVTTQPSLSVAEIVAEMLRESDNSTAEILVKELGHRAGEGSWARGLESVRAALKDEGLSVDALRTVDGSGLDRNDRATCRLVLDAVTDGGPEGPVAEGLAVAAQTGTLTLRFQGHPAAGRLRAKTGSLLGVAALAGYLPVEDDPPLAFALIANEIPREPVGRALQERVAEALTRYPEAPPAASIEPGGGDGG